MMPARISVQSLVASAIAVAAFTLSLPVQAQGSPPRPANASSMDAKMDANAVRAVNVSKDGLALHGYDPVAYFADGAPSQGRPEFSANYNGATYLFASAENRGRFLASPDAYAPQYGGYCAMGVAGGAKFDIDPTAWRVENGRLYLNKDKRTQTMWLRDVPGNIVKADSKWPTVAGKPMR